MYNVTPANTNKSNVQMYHNSQNKKDNDAGRHTYNIERRIMERGDFFNVGTRVKKETDTVVKHSSSMTGSRGEITGHMYDTDILEQGMPMRDFTTASKIKHKSVPNLDFDLFSSEVNTDIMYHDPLSGGTDYSFSDLNQSNELLNPVSKQPTPVDIVSKSVNLFSFDVLTKLKKSVNSSIALSPLAVMCPFTVLYYGSRGGTEQGLAKQLFLPNKELAVKGVSELLMNIDRSKFIFRTSFVLIPQLYSINNSFRAETKTVSTTCKYNNQDTDRINKMVEKFSSNSVHDILKYNSINSSSSVILLSTFNFTSRWRYSFDKSKTRNINFYGVVNRVVSAMCLSNIDCRYFEDDSNQILELDYEDYNFTMGFILPKSNKLPTLTEHQFNTYISGLNVVHVEQIAVPRFTQNSRINMSNFFRNNGAIDVFTNGDFKDMTPSSNILYVSDTIHQLCISVSEEGASKHNYSKRTGKRCSFIANHPFIYYIRYIPTNTLVVVGQQL